MLGSRSGVILRYATTPSTTIASTTTKTVSGFFTLNFAILLLLCGHTPQNTIIEKCITLPPFLQEPYRKIHESVTISHSFRQKSSHAEQIKKS